MNRLESSFKPLMWFIALLLAAFAAGCGGEGGVVSKASAQFEGRIGT
jgi:hypothetical protein